MINEVVLSSSFCFWNLRVVFEAAREFVLPVEVIPLRMDSLSRVRKLHSKFLDVEIASVHAPFATHLQYLQNAIRPGVALRERIFHGFFWPVLMGGFSAHHPAIKIALEYEVPLVVHPTDVSPEIAVNCGLNSNLVLLENLGPQEGIISPQKIISLVEKNSFGGVCFDIKHALQSGWNVLNAFKSLSLYVRQIHLCDICFLEEAKLTREIICSCNDLQQIKLVLEINPGRKAVSSIRGALRFLKDNCGINY